MHPTFDRATGYRLPILLLPIFIITEKHGCASLLHDTIDYRSPFTSYSSLSLSLSHSHSHCPLHTPLNPLKGSGARVTRLPHTPHSHSHTVSVYVLAGKTELEAISNVCYLLDHLFDQFGMGVVVRAGGHNLEKAVLENKTAVVKLTVLFEQVTKVDAFVEIANLGNEQHMIPAGCPGAGVRQHSLKSSGAKRNNNNGLGVIVIRVLAAYLFGKLARIVEDISHRF